MLWALPLVLPVAVVWILIIDSRVEHGRPPGLVAANQPLAIGRADVQGTGVSAQKARDVHRRTVDTIADARADDQQPPVGSPLPTVSATAATHGVSPVEHQAMNGDTNAASQRRYARGTRLDFRGADLAGADFRGGDMANADLRGANLRDADFSGANLNGANLEDAVFDSTNLHRANLRGASLSGVEIDGINMASVDFSRADLREARLSCDECGLRSDARGANFAGADLRGADFGRTVIHRALLDDADLRSADMTHAHGIPRSMRGALYDRNTRFPPSIRPEVQQMKLVEAETPKDGPASP